MNHREPISSHSSAGMLAPWLGCAWSCFSWLPLPLSTSPLSSGLLAPAPTQSHLPPSLVAAGSSLCLVPAFIICLLSRQLPPSTAPLPLEETALATGSRPAGSWVFPPTLPSPPKNKVAREGEGAIRPVQQPQGFCSGLGTPSGFHISSSSTPGVPGALGSGAGRVPFSPLSLSLSQPPCPQKSASSFPNVSSSRASARERHRKNKAFKQPISARISFHSFGPAFPTSWYSPWTISSPVSSPFPSVHWASSPCPVPPLAFCLSHSLAYSLQPLPLSGVMAWIVCLCQALYLLERGRKKRKKKPQTPRSC